MAHIEQTARLIEGYAFILLPDLPFFVVDMANIKRVVYHADSDQNPEGGAGALQPPQQQ